MYPILDIKIPQDKRRDINNKILHVIDNNINHPAITKEVIFNTFSGEGALHGLNFNDYNNYHSFSAAKKEKEYGQFFTPLLLSRFVANMLKPNNNDTIADLTAGHGSLINFMPNKSNIHVNEWELKAFKVLRYLFPECHVTNEDIRSYSPSISFDIVLGNPPYNLAWNVGNDKIASQYYYMLKAHKLLKPSGLLVLIVPSSFLSDDFTEGGYIKQINSLYNHIQSFVLPANMFKDTGANIETKIMLFQKKSEHIQEKLYNTAHSELLDVLTDEKANSLYTQYIKPLYEQKESVKAKLILEAIQQSNDSSDFEYKVKKMLFDIKRTKATKEQYNRAEAYLLKFRTQEKPHDMKYEEWVKVRVTENKVLSYLKIILKNQHNKSEEKTLLVKTRYGLKMKPYSRKQTVLLNKSTEVNEMSFNDMILQGEYPFKDQTYRELFEKKKKAYEKQNKPLNEIHNNSEFMRFLDSFSLYNSVKNQEINLFDYQKEALNKILHKQYSMLNFQQGLGKTECCIAYLKYLQQCKAVKNFFIISSSLSINMTWAERLSAYDIPFKLVNSLSSINKIGQGDIVLITFNMLAKYQKHIKQYVKKQSQKVALIVDESHKLSNNSQRTRATLNVFRKAKYKLLATGTPTKNTINELFPQLELLFNNSINMLSTCEKIQREDMKTKELKEELNKHYMKPFPANKPSVFKMCFSPSRQSVFGIQRNDQNIYNSEHLKALVDSFIITKKFHEVAGDKYKVTTHRIIQNDNEKEVYKKIMDEFYTMIPNYFRSTGNHKKDAMLRIIRQLQLMIKSVSIPHKLKEYNGFQEPNKYLHIQKLIEKNNEKVIVGTVFIDSSSYYHRKLSSYFKDRKVYLIQGDVSFKKRQQIISDFEKSSNAILITTQQSLSESVNIPSCNMVICEALQWNVSNLEQFYFRTIRIDSKEKTNVHLITYNNTVEQNMLALLMSKERINEFIKTREHREESSIFNEYDIDLDVFNSIITKEYDEEGHMRLTWGEQKII